MDRQTLRALLAVIVVLASGCSSPLGKEPAANGPSMAGTGKPAPFGTPYQCGEASAIFGALGERARMVVGAETFDLKPVVSASGARYRGNGTAAGFPPTARRLTAGPPGWGRPRSTATLSKHSPAASSIVAPRRSRSPAARTA